MVHVDDGARDGQPQARASGTFLAPTGASVEPIEDVLELLGVDPDAVIGATQNVAELQRDMRRDAAERIIRITEASLGK